MIRLLIILLCIVALYTPDTSVAQEMSVAKTRFYGRITGRTRNLEEYGSKTYRTFVALFPEDKFATSYFEGEPPASYYNFIQKGFIATTSVAYTLIEPPFGGYNFINVPLGNYWFCKFDIDDDMTEIDILQSHSLVLSGCQYVKLNSSEPIKQNYYVDGVGFWIDDIVEKTLSKPAPAPSSSECIAEE